MTAYELRISDWSSDVCSSDLFDFHQLLRHVIEQWTALAADFEGGAVRFVDEPLHFEIDLAHRLFAVIDLARRLRAEERRAAFAVEIGRASCRESVCPYVYVSVVVVSS